MPITNDLSHQVHTQEADEVSLGVSMSSPEEEITKAVRWRYRICHYLFRPGAIWILTGAVVGLFAIRYEWWGWPRHTAD